MPASKFHQLKTFPVPKDAVVSVGISVFGDFVCAVGKSHTSTRRFFKLTTRFSGYNGVSCWNVKTSRAMALPGLKGTYAMKTGHIFTVCAWVFFRRTSAHALILGTLKGRMYVWDWNESEEVHVL